MDLNIDIICANSPQAKGRIERAFGTLQDRLVKELRLAGISTVAAANACHPAPQGANMELSTPHGNVSSFPKIVRLGSCIRTIR